MQRWLDLLLALLPAGVVHRMVVRLGWTVVRRSGRGLTEEKHTMNRKSKSRGALSYIDSSDYSAHVM